MLTIVILRHSQFKLIYAVGCHCFTFVLAFVCGACVVSSSLLLSASCALAVLPHVRNLHAHARARLFDSLLRSGSDIIAHTHTQN